MNVSLCDRCNSLLLPVFAVVQTTSSDGKGAALLSNICQSCKAEHDNFFTTLPAWGVAAPSVVPLQIIPAKVG